MKAYGTRRPGRHTNKGKCPDTVRGACDPGAYAFAQAGRKLAKKRARQEAAEEARDFEEGLTFLEDQTFLDAEEQA